MDRTTAGAVCWTTTVLLVVGEATARLGVRTPYSAVRNYVSDLGSVRCGELALGFYRAPICSPWHLAMNAGFVLTGIGLAGGALLTRPLWGGGRARTWGTVLLVLGGIGKIVAGLAHADAQVVAHLAGGVLSGPVATAGILVLGRATRPTHPGLARFALVCGVIGILGLVATAAAGAGVGIGTVGLAERVAVYPTVVWAAGTGLALLLARRSSR